MKKILLSIITALSAVTAAACQYEAPDIERLAGFCTPYISKINSIPAWDWNKANKFFASPPSDAALHLPITVELSSAASGDSTIPLYGVVGYGSLVDLPENTQLEVKLDYSTDNGTTWILLARKLFRNARQQLLSNYILGRNLLNENLSPGTKILIRLRCGPPGLTNSAFNPYDLSGLRVPDITAPFPAPAYGTVEFVSEYTIAGPRRPGRN